VSVNLPDGSTTTGTVIATGTAATPASSGSSPTVAVVVTLGRTSPTSTLDQAPVTVNINNSSARGVLAVPTTALLALAGGGDAVEVINRDGTHHLVEVTVGIFDDQAGLVQITGNLSVGEKVVVAA
jgi:multidrug efflux pump subunit AcrA (membrane-fusion protein)